MQVVSVTIFVTVATVALVVSVRLGILLGRRLDRAMEARAAADGRESTEELARAAASGRPDPSRTGIGREEDRGE